MRLSAPFPKSESHAERKALADPAVEDEAEEEFDMNGIGKMRAQEAFRGTGRVASPPRRGRSRDISPGVVDRRYHDSPVRSRRGGSDGRRESPSSPKGGEEGALKKDNKPNGKRNYPKEKWVPRSPSEKLSSRESKDEYVKKRGKYEVDRNSLVQSKFLERDFDERYGVPAILSNNSSEDGIAKWRSYDEDEEKDDSGIPDWDAALDNSRKISIMSVEPDDDATMTSLEMFHYNPEQTKVLAHEHRIPGKSVSFQDIQNVDVDGLARLKKKPDKIMKKHREARRHPDVKSRYQGTQRGRRGASYRVGDYDTKHRIRTMSSVSDSNSEEEEEEEEYIPKRRGRRIRDIIEEVDVEDQEEEEPTDTSGSSASYDADMEYERTRQMRFRQVDKTRSRPLRPMQPIYYSDDEENEVSRTANLRRRSVKPEKKPAKRGWLQKILKKEPSEPLPWDLDKIGTAAPAKRGFFGRKKKQKHRSVQDLPFPKSESLDGSLLELDKYQLAEMSRAHPMMVHPISRAAAAAESKASVSNSSVVSSSTRSNERPIRRAKRGLGQKLKSLFL